MIPSVTALRGIAALLVVVFHFDSLLGFIQLGPIAPGTGLLSRGYLWVDFFFVLSGFIITHVYGGQFIGGIPRSALRAFLLARFSRLYPLHFVALSLSVVLYFLVYSKMPAPKDGPDMTEEIYSFPMLPLHYLLLIGFGLTPLGWNVPAWSIGAEWWTYLLALPTFQLLHRGVSKRTWLVPLGSVAGLWLLMTLYPRHMLDITFDFGLLRCALSFAVGICLYQLYRTEWGSPRLSSDGALLGAVALTALTLHYPAPPLIPDFKNPPPVPPLTPVVDALSPLVFGLLILCAARNEGRGRALLESRPLRYLGEISYSLYLMQGMAFPLIFLLGGNWKQAHPNAPMPLASMLGLLALIVGVTFLLALVTYHTVEVPARRWLRRRFGT